MKEAERSVSAFFVTLTYDTDHVPISDNGFMSLKKRDLQLFFKNCRNYATKKLRESTDLKCVPIKYYAAGEYGSEKARPHYHIILFNATIDMVKSSWLLGSVDIGTCTIASVGYTLKYINKETRIPLHARDDRQKEFSLMSKKMGDNYVTKAMKRWHKRDLVNRVYVPLTDGMKIAMPRYYKQLIYTMMNRLEIKNHFASIAPVDEYAANVRKSRSKKDDRSLKF